MQLPQIILRGIQLFLTVLITALVGNVIAEAFAGNASAINYAIFVAAFSWIVLIFGGVAAFVTSLAIPVVLIAMDALATLFTFIAGVVLAARLGVHSCGNQVCCDRLLSKPNLLISANRATFLVTASQTALKTLQSAAASSKLARLSFGSCLLRMPLARR